MVLYVLTWLTPVDNFAKIVRSDQGFALLYLYGNLLLCVADAVRRSVHHINGNVRQINFKNRLDVRSVLLSITVSWLLIADYWQLLFAADVKNAHTTLSAGDLVHGWRAIFVVIVLTEFAFRAFMVQTRGNGCYSLAHLLSGQTKGATCEYGWNCCLWQILPLSIVAPHFNSFGSIVSLFLICTLTGDRGGFGHLAVIGRWNFFGDTLLRSWCVARWEQVFRTPLVLEYRLGFDSAYFILVEVALYTMRVHSGVDSYISGSISESVAAVVFLFSSHRVQVHTLHILNRDESHDVNMLIVLFGLVFFCLLTWMAPKHLDCFSTIVRSDHGFALLYLSGHVLTRVVDACLEMRGKGVVNQDVADVFFPTRPTLGLLCLWLLTADSWQLPFSADVKNAHTLLSAADLAHGWRATFVIIMLSEFAFRVFMVQRRSKSCYGLAHLLFGQTRGNVSDGYFWNILPLSIIAPHSNSFVSIVGMCVVCTLMSGSGRYSGGYGHIAEGKWDWLDIDCTPLCRWCIARCEQHFRVHMQGKAVVIFTYFMLVEVALYTMRAYSGVDSYISGSISESVAATVFLFSSHRVHIRTLRIFNQNQAGHLHLIFGVALFYALTWMAPSYIDDYATIVRSDQSFALLYLSGRSIVWVFDCLFDATQWLTEVEIKCKQVEQAQREKHEREEQARRESLQIEAANSLRTLVNEAQGIFTSGLFTSRDYDTALLCYHKAELGMLAAGFDGTFTCKPNETAGLPSLVDVDDTAAVQVEDFASYKKLLAACLFARYSRATKRVEAITLISELLQKGGEYLSISDFDFAWVVRDAFIMAFLRLPQNQVYEKVDNAMSTSLENNASVVPEDATRYIDTIIEFLRCLQLAVRRPAMFNTGKWAIWRDVYKHLVVPMLQARLMQMHDLRTVSPTYRGGEDQLESILRKCESMRLSLDATLPESQRVYVQGMGPMGTERQQMVRHVRAYEIQVLWWMASVKYALARSGSCDTRLAACDAALQHIVDLELHHRMVPLLAGAWVETTMAERETAVAERETLRECLVAQRELQQHVHLKRVEESLAVESALAVQRQMEVEATERKKKEVCRAVKQAV